MTPQNSPVLWWPKKYPQFHHTPKNIHFSENPKKYRNSKFWTPQNGPSLRLYKNIRVPLLPPPMWTDTDRNMWTHTENHWIHIWINGQAFRFVLMLNVSVNSYGHVGMVSSPNHTFFLSKLDLAVNQYFGHTLSLVTDNNPSWISGKEENYHWNYFTINLHESMIRSQDRTSHPGPAGRYISTVRLSTYWPIQHYCKYYKMSIVCTGWTFRSMTLIA